MKQTIYSRGRQTGAALIIGLILLLVVTLFAVTSMSTATLDLTLAANTQYAENAFQAAESAIEAEIVAGPATPDVARQTNYSFGPASDADTTTSFSAIRLAPPGYSLTEYQADHYRIMSTGSGGTGARSMHEQGFFVVVPNGSGG